MKLALTIALAVVSTHVAVVSTHVAILRRVAPALEKPDVLYTYPAPVYTPPEQMPVAEEWNSVSKNVPLPTDEWMSETQFLERVMRSFGKQRTDYHGLQRMTGFQRGKIFDEHGMFAFDDTIRSVAFDVGAATNPLNFDLDQDASQVVFNFEPLQWKMLETAIETDSVNLQKRGGCDNIWDSFCAMHRFYVFPAAVSKDLGHAKFHATANPYCGSLETFSDDRDQNAIDPALKNSEDPEIRGVFDACYKDAGIPGDVPTISLKSIIERIPTHIAIKYMKIDAQGHDFKVLQSAAEQISRIEYVRFESQVDPPPDRRLVSGVPSYKDMERQLAAQGLKHMPGDGPHAACNYDSYSSNFSKAVNEMECVFCRELPCMESGKAPLGENPRAVIERKKHAKA